MIGYESIWVHIKGIDSSLDDQMVNQLLLMFVDKNRSLCSMKKWKWVVRDADRGEVDKFISDDSNIDAAKKAISTIVPSVSRFPVKLKIEGDEILLHSESEVEDFAGRMLKINMKLLEKLKETQAKKSTTVITASGKTRKILEQIAIAASDRPEIFVGASSRAEFVDRIIKMTKTKGLKTFYGKDWTPKNMSNYQVWLAKRIDQLVKENEAKSVKVV